MKVVYSITPQLDFLGIHKHIFDRNPKRAFTFIEELEAHCASRGDMPLAFPIVFNQNGFAIRRRVYKHYLVFYRVEEPQVVILRAGHGAQDWAAIFTGDD